MKNEKKYFFTLILISLFSVIVKAQTWVALTSPTTQNLRSVFFLSKDTGFVGGGSAPSSAVLFKTQDGGNTWSSITVPYSINKIYFLTKDSGYIFLQNAQLYKTTNGGSSWTYLGNFGSGVGQIFFQNSSVGFIRGTNYIWRTLNGGASWDSINIAPTGSSPINWYEINFISTTIGYISNIPNAIWKTTNQGASWSLNSTPISSSSIFIHDFKFFNSNLGIAVADSCNRLLKTNNGGASWSCLSFPYPTYLGGDPIKILFTSNNKVFIFSSPNIFTSNDTGNTWSQMTIYPTPTYTLNDFTMVNDSIGYAVGNGGIIYKTSPGVAAPPTTAASTFFIGNVQAASMVLNWTSGNGSARIVVACATSNTLIAPTNGVSCTASSTFGSGSQIGTGNYVVYNGTGSSVTVSGLNVYTAYYYRIYEYNGTGTYTNYLTSSYASNGAMTLPVKLVSFTANKINEEVNLNWQTASELNNDYFEIERSVDGSLFTAIGKVKGHGTTSVENNYQYTDNLSNFQLPTSNFYYRLKQVDFNGNFEYSSIVEITTDKKQLVELNIYPNPSSTELHIESLNTEKLNVQLFDITGKQMTENILFTNSTIISTQAFSQGIYFIRITNTDTGLVKTQKVVVVK